MDSNLSNVGHLRSVGVHVFMCSSLEGVVGTLAAKQRGRGGRQAGQGRARQAGEAGQGRQGKAGQAGQGRAGRQAVSVGSCCYQTLHTTATPIPTQDSKTRNGRAEKHRQFSSHQV